MKAVVNTGFFKNGKIFEKVGVNFSEVSGKFSKDIKRKYREQVKKEHFGLREYQL